MPLLDDIDRLLRDHTGYSGDGHGGVGALPVGDRSTARYPINKRDIRAILKIIAQTMGDPQALQDVLDQVAAKADRANSGKLFGLRSSAINVGQSALPASIGLIATREGDNFVIRAPNLQADDPLFGTEPWWGVLMRLPRRELLDAKADQSVVAALQAEVNGKADLQNSGASFTSRQAIIDAGQAAVPGDLGVIYHWDASYVVFRGPAATTNDPLFGAYPSWGIIARVPRVEFLNAVALTGDSDELVEGETNLLLRPRERDALDQVDLTPSSVVWGVRDSEDNLGVGLSADGSFICRRVGEEIYDTGDDPRAFADGTIKDLNGNVSFGPRRDGTVFVNLDAESAARVGGGALPVSDVRGMGSHEVSGVTIYSPTLRRFFSNADGDTTAYLQRRDILSNSAVIERDVLRVTLSYGQSLGIGGSSNPPEPAYSVLPPIPRMGLMFNTGVRGSGTTAAWNASAAVDLVGAYEQLAPVATQSETPGTGYLAYRARADAAAGRARQARFYHAAGAGGQSIENLAVGSQPWSNLIAALDRVIDLAAIYGMRVEVEAFVWTQGEANAASDPVDYQTKLEAIIAQFRAECDSRGVSPAGLPVAVFMDQVSSPAGEAAGANIGRTPNIAFAAIAASDSRAWISTAKYMLHLSDNVHLQAPDYRIFGEYIARAVDRVAATGDYEPCHITGATLIGDAIEVQVHVPSGDLVRDTSQVPAVAHDGFRYQDGGGTASIASVTIGPTVAQQCTVTIQLSNAPSGADPRISYAYANPSPLMRPNFGAVGNLRDSDQTDSTVPAGVAGNGKLHNWLLVQPPIYL